MKCSYCGSVKHTEKNCPKTHEGWVNRLHLYCTYCGSEKHNVNACPKLNGTVALRNKLLQDHFIKD